jgi:hypothetical protein
METLEATERKDLHRFPDKTIGTSSRFFALQLLAHVARH